MSRSIAIIYYDLNVKTFFCYYIAMLSRNFDLGNVPILFNNISCNSFLSNLFQCFDLQNIGIGIHKCQHNEVAGVSCQQILENITATSIVTVRTTVTGIATDVKDLIHDVTYLYVSNTESAVISTAGSILLLLAIVVAGVSMAFIV